MEKLKLCVSGQKNVEMVINTKRHSELMNILDSSEWVNKEDYYGI